MRYDVSVIGLFILDILGRPVSRILLQEAKRRGRTVTFICTFSTFDRPPWVAARASRNLCAMLNLKQ